MRVLTRGANYLGQCGTGPKTSCSSTFKQIANFSFPSIRLSVNYGQSFAFTEDKVFYWGFTYDSKSFIVLQRLFNFSNSLMTAASYIHPAFYKFPYNPAFVQSVECPIRKMSSGAGHSILLTDDNKVSIIGENFFNQLGIKSNQNMYNFVATEDERLDKITDIACGLQHSLFLTDKGVVFGCGKSDNCQFGAVQSNYTVKNFTSEDRSEKVVELETSHIPGKIIKLAAGKYHSVVLTDKYECFVVGLNRYGQCGMDLKQAELKHFKKIEFGEPTKIVDVVCGDEHNVFLDLNGKVYANGSNKLGQVNGELDGLVDYYVEPVRVNFNTKIKRIIAGNFKSAAIDENDRGFQWGGIFYSREYSLARQPRLEGINCLQDEPELTGTEVKDIGLGLLHDVVVVN